MADETTEKAEKPIDTSVKARYWWAVLYQENMVDGWRDNIEELLQLPYAYCERAVDVPALSVILPIARKLVAV